jgi:hypothetical protein
MTPHTFATQSLGPRDQLEAWREWYETVFDLIPQHQTGDEFPAEIHIWKLGGLALSRTSAPSVHVVRTKGHLRRDPVARETSVRNDPLSCPPFQVAGA